MTDGLLTSCRRSDATSNKVLGRERFFTPDSLAPLIPSIAVDKLSKLYPL
jgi:hypothetical protein